MKPPTRASAPTGRASTPPQPNPAAGILRKTTAADRGLVERPVLAPHLTCHPLGDRRVLLTSETFHTLLGGPIHADLLPQLDGRTHREVAAALSPTHAAGDVQAAIISLASRGYVVSADHALAAGRAAYWSALGASPRWAEQRLGASTVAVAGDDGSLARRLDAIGVGAGTAETEDPVLSVLVCADYLDERHDDIDRRHIDSGAPWMLVRPNGVQPIFGPVFRPAERGPCWACLAYRLRGHQEVHNFLRNRGGAAAAVTPRAAEPAVLETVCGLAAAEIAKWLVLGDEAPIHEHAVTLDAVGLVSGRHRVMRRPQCRACGDPALYRADRPPEPVRLRPSPKPVHNSGGQRSVAPDITVAKYRHLISPVSGVVTWVTRTTDETDRWLHVYWAGNNFALRSRKLSALRRSLRSKSAGKGSTPQQSEASALCEAVERYCGAFHGEEIRQRRSLADFERAGTSEAIAPNEVQLFSERQLDDAERINARGHPYNFVPARLDPDARIDWTPAWSLTQSRHRYLPTAILYSMAAERDDGPTLRADSNGCAAGNTLEEAILHGFYELVERDAFAIWWYNRLRLPEVDLASFGDEYLASAREYYGRLGRAIWVLDATSDLGIPVFVAVSRRTDGETEDILYGAGAHADPHVAALRAVCELNQCLQWVLGPGQRASGLNAGASPAVNDPMSLWWWRNGRLADHPYLAPAPDAARRGASDYTVPDTADTREDVERCRALIEAKGMEFLVLDQTRPDIGMPVARVIVPGLRHFWERFAPGRLFDVPVAMGRRAGPIPEAQLNPIPVIA